MSFTFVSVVNRRGVEADSLEAGAALALRISARPCWRERCGAGDRKEKAL